MLVIIYLILGYWATGRTIYANKVIVYSGLGLFYRRAFYGALFGWILIPVAIIRLIFHI